MEERMKRSHISIGEESAGGMLSGGSSTKYIVVTLRKDGSISIRPKHDSELGLMVSDATFQRVLRDYGMSTDFILHVPFDCHTIATDSSRTRSNNAIHFLTTIC